MEPTNKSLQYGAPVATVSGAETETTGSTRSRKLVADGATAAFILIGALLNIEWVLSFPTYPPIMLTILVFLWTAALLVLAWTIRKKR